MLQVVSLPGGDAESLDGIRWILYVSHPDILAHTGLSEVRYGTWTRNGGLDRAKVRGTARAGIIERLGGRLIEALEQVAEDVPFSRDDHFECWLLDEEQGVPLALIDSASRKADCGFWDHPVWRPGREVLQHFRSQFGDGPRLQAMVAAAAGAKPRSLWFNRRLDGSGLSAGERVFDTRDFPPLLISEDWPGARDRDLVQAFFNWTSPWLLQLPELSSERRRELEKEAWKRPDVSARVYRLFPEVLDEGGLTAARVAARLSQPKESVAVPEPFYPFFNE